MRRGAVLAAAGCSAAALTLVATPSPALIPIAPSPSIGDQSGVALLTAAVAAGQQVSYRGTQFVMFWSETGSTSAVVEVTHAAGEGALLRVAPTPQNPGGSVFHEDTGGGVGGIGRGSLELLRRNFEAVRMGTESVAGRVSDIVVVRRPGSSPAARYWIDRESHLLLRREVLDSDGQVLEATAFITLDLVQSPLNRGYKSMPTASGSSIGIAVGAVDKWRSQGWLMPPSLPGGLDLVDARVSGAGKERAVHLLYSDGVSTLSLFQQRGRLDTSDLDGWEKAKVGGVGVWVKNSYPRQVVWSGGKWVFTLVADCQRRTLDEIVAGLPHPRPHRGFFNRIGRGLARVGSWINPFA